MNNEYNYSMARLNFPCYRKHFFSNRPYTLYLFDQSIVMTDDTSKPPKYQLKLNLTTHINWIVKNNNGIIIFEGFEYAYQNRKKIMNAEHHQLNLLKNIIGGSVIYENLLNFFKVDENLGKGMAGIVKKYLSKLDGEFYAVKIVDKKKNIESKDGIISLINEIQILNETKHPQIVEFYEIYHDQKNFYLIMEYIEGQNLHTQMIQKPIGYSTKNVISIASQILEGVSFLHERKIMHRDLNPLNIMISDDNKIKLIDLGLAIRTIQGQNVIYPVCGTPGYMAPEVINYNKDIGYNEKADVFSVGLIIYKILTGECVFQKNKVQTLLQVNKQCDIEIKKFGQSVQEENILKLIEMMLEKDPSIRLSAREALNALKDIERQKFNLTQFQQRKKKRQSHKLGVRDSTSKSQSKDSFDSKTGNLDKKKNSTVTRTHGDSYFKNFQSQFQEDGTDISQKLFQTKMKQKNQEMAIE